MADNTQKIGSVDHNLVMLLGIKHDCSTKEVYYEN